MKMDVTLDAPDLMGWKLLERGAQEKTLRIVADEYLLIQRERIARGVDVEGRPFKPYHPNYRDRKARAGRTGENQFLRLSGRMLKGQTVDVRVRGKGNVTARFSFDGMRPSSRIEDPAKRSAYRRTWRSQRGGFAKKWRGGRRARVEAAKRGGRAHARLVVTTGDDMVDNALLAAVNDLIRPFVGVNKAELDKLTRLLATEIDRRRK